jgi:3-oxoacyl-[acyl-carrier protein] reductase
VAAASRGLGFAVAKALVAEGCRVVVCGRDATRLAAAARALGERATGIPADVATREGAQRFVEEATSALGGLDILVTNAGGPPAGTVEDLELGRYEEALALNLLSVVAMCRAAVPAMRRQGFGRIVAITSIAVREPIPGLVLSNTARAGATAFLKTLAREVAQYGITVNSVQPGYHATERLRELGVSDGLTSRIPVGRLGDPDELGALVAFVCSPKASYLTGAAIPLDGGLSGGLQ